MQCDRQLSIVDETDVPYQLVNLPAKEKEREKESNTFVSTAQILIYLVVAPTWYATLITSLRYLTTSKICCLSYLILSTQDLA